jgi:hypothetical protein
VDRDVLSSVLNGLAAGLGGQGDLEGTAFKCPVGTSDLNLAAYYSAQGACNSSPSGRKVRVPIGITAIASSGSPSVGPKSW